MKRDDYILGGRPAKWLHFVVGLVVGAGMGAWISLGLVDTRWAFIALTAAIALIVAICCSLWGDAAWEKVASLFWWLS